MDHEVDHEVDHGRIQETPHTSQQLIIYKTRFFLRPYKIFYIVSRSLRKNESSIISIFTHGRQCVIRGIVYDSRIIPYIYL